MKAGVRRSVEPRACFPGAPASSFAVVPFPPVVANRVARAGQPLLVAAQLFQYFCGEEFRAVARRMSKRFQQACRDQHRNLMCFKAEKPSCLRRVKTGRGNFPTQKLRLLCDLIHNENTLIQIYAVAVYPIHENNPRTTPPKVSRYTRLRRTLVRHLSRGCY